MTRREHKRLAKGNPLFGSRQGEQWWKAVELGEAPFLSFAPEGATSWRDKGAMVIGWELPWSLPINGTGLAPRGHRWRHVFESHPADAFDCMGAEWFD